MAVWAASLAVMWPRWESRKLMDTLLTGFTLNLETAHL